MGAQQLSNRLAEIYKPESHHRARDNLHAHLQGSVGGQATLIAQSEECHRNPYSAGGNHPAYRVCSNS